MRKDKKNIPEISIDEALQLYISMAFPQGMPEGEEGERILKIIKEKIASERPEWAKASGWLSDQDEDTGSYSQLKQRVVEDASKEDLPEDSEERYLYLRRQEAKENSEHKKIEQQEQQAKTDFRKAHVESKATKEDELLKRAALIKKVLLERASNKMMPDFGENKVTASTSSSVSKPQISAIKHETIHLDKPTSTQKRQEVEHGRTISASLDKNNEFRSKRKPDAKEWFKDFKSLNVEDRVESIKSYNQKKREMLENKLDLMWDGRSSGKKKDALRFNDEFEINQGLSIGHGGADEHGLTLE
ncbi:hypothetical protein [Ekhidna sp.]|uniref:hypothetical protein n=1 Tax=Ekhidna sp. TaxID=2608089 RepID=UPI003298558E